MDDPARAPAGVTESKLTAPDAWGVLPQEFIKFLREAGTSVDLTDAGSLQRTWRAWSTLFAPDAVEPEAAAFAAYARSVRGTAPERARPLVGWSFDGQLRHSQVRILNAVRTTTRDPLHIVAPPGAGKTLIGLLLAIRAGDPALALAPTSTIRGQWARTARDLATPDATISEDPEVPGDLTALTYQMLSVVDSNNPFDALAAQRWVDDLVEGGRDQAEATAWVEDLAAANPDAYRRGIRRRARSIRTNIVREDPARIEQALHPNARALLDRLVDHGVATIILDECHHLLDHWALVIACLVAKQRARGLTPLIIGLTATLPSAEDGPEYENYTGLLGDVDYELPTPVVVKEGNLAPYKSFAWFTEPTAPETDFLRTHSERLTELIRATLTGDGGEFLAQVLQPADAPSPEAGLALAFKADPRLTEAACRMLTSLDPGHELVALFNHDLRTPPETEQSIRVLARYALLRILPDPARAEQWRTIKAVLADFGFHLTDRGIRTGRDPIDAMLATSAAKATAVGQIIALERASNLGERVRAVVVCDYAVHGNQRGRTGDPAGALRCFATVVADPRLADLHPLLVTSNHVRIAARDEAVYAEALATALDVEVTFTPVDEDEAVLAASVNGTAALAAVSGLMTAGVTRLLVGTRGLLGEGWDCPAANTLIDLSAVTTSSATQQLRGRTLRLDPAWPEKVAHNWTVTCVPDPKLGLDTCGEERRLLRKLTTVWGLTTTPGSDAIVKGAEHTLTRTQIDDLARRKPAADLTAGTIKDFPPRALTRARWRIGEPYSGVESVRARIDGPRIRTPLRTSFTFEAVLVALLGILGSAAYLALSTWLGTARSLTATVITVVVALALSAAVTWREVRTLWRSTTQYAFPHRAYAGVTHVIAQTLHRRGDIEPIGYGNIHVVGMGDRPRRPDYYEIRVEADGQDAILDQLAKFFGPITSPRFVLEVGLTGLTWASPVARVAAFVASRAGTRPRYFAVPARIGRRRADAEFFAERFAVEVGPCRLYEITEPADMAILTRARRDTDGADIGVRTGQVWA